MTRRESEGGLGRSSQSSTANKTAPIKALVDCSFPSKVGKIGSGQSELSKVAISREPMEGSVITVGRVTPAAERSEITKQVIKRQIKLSEGQSKKRQ